MGRSPCGRKARGHRLTQLSRPSLLLGLSLQKAGSREEKHDLPKLTMPF